MRIRTPSLVNLQIRIFKRFPFEMVVQVELHLYIKVQKKIYEKTQEVII